MINPIFLKDAYKVSHPFMYPKGTTLLFSNFTPRKSRMPGVEHSVFFGLKYFLKEYLDAHFAGYFFNYGGNCSDAHAAVQKANFYGSIMRSILGKMDYPKHIEALHKLGYLPIAIYALPEGSIVPNGVPALVMYNTHPDFFWVPGMLETLMSCTIWQACTSATIAREYRLLLGKYAAQTSDQPGFVEYQAHDFSMRGMSSLESAIISGMAHLLYFKGTDTIPAIIAAKEYYDRPIEIASVPATEHSIMSAGGRDNELETYRRLINETYPSGILSIVSDTWDLWRVIGTYLRPLKSDIVKRDGKVVIRPDSGDPVDIICGKDRYQPFIHNLEMVGVVEALWDIFGGTINSKGYKELDSHIGVIYGDSITLERARCILERLKNKGFASTNIVFGIGSFTYQYNTRDTLGWAMKCTYAEINGEGVNIYKDPVTDDGTKKSAKGLLRVIKSFRDGSYLLDQEITWDDFNIAENELKLVYKDGKIYD